MKRHHLLLVVYLCTLAGCPQQQVLTTTRNLNRPGPLAMVCATRNADSGVTTGLSPSACTTDAGVTEAGGLKNSLYGFVANTARGEVSVFKSVPSGEPLIDLDRRTPGFGTIPIGAFPTDLKASTDGCRVFSANAGSCDLSVIDVPAVLQFAAGTLSVPSGAAVSRLLPRTAAGAVLHAQPQELTLIPASMPAKDPNGACPTRGTYRAYVTFPRCGLVAELDLQTGKILHGVQIRPDGSFFFTNNPVCPVDCILPGEQKRVDAGPVDGPRRDSTPLADLRRDAGPPPDRSAVDAPPPPDGPRPDAPAAQPDLARSDSAPRSDAGSGDGQGLGAVSPFGTLPSSLALTTTDDPADQAPRLFISLAGAGFIGVLDIDPSTGDLQNPRRILLADRPTTTRLRLSPPTLKLGRFLYAVAGDRSLRVVSTELERECETLLDPLALKPAEAGLSLSRARCYPVGAPDTPPRRVAATGHGLTFGASAPQDVVFVTSQAGVPDAGYSPELGPGATPLRGIFAMVVTSDGSAYVIDVEDWNLVSSSSSTLSPSRLPHQIRNALAGTNSQIPDAGVTAVSNAGSGGVPVVVSSVIQGGAQVDLPGQGVRLRHNSAGIASPWQLVYEDRLVARWSGDLKATRDTLALFDAGWDFCGSDVRGTIEENGRKVRHGDIMVLVGCKDDTECGIGQVCVQPVSQQSEFGLCLDSSRKDDLFRTCAPFLGGSREYLVRRATSDTLTLDALPVEPQTIFKQTTQPAGGCRSNADCDPYYLCALDNQPGTGLKAGDCFRPGCEKDSDCFTSSTGNICVQPLDGSPKVCSSVPLPIETGGTCQTDNDCRPKKPVGAVCTSDSSCGDLGTLECRLPSSNVVDKICMDKGMVCSSFPGLQNTCVRKTPCFIELQRYDVRVGRGFLVGGFRRSYADPTTQECTEDPSKSPLFVDRLPVGLPVYPVILGAQCTAPVSPFDVATVPQPDPCFERTSDGYIGFTLKGPGTTVSNSQPGPATVVHYANPDILFSLGLSHLTALPSSTSGRDGGVSGSSTVQMPARGLTIQIDLNSGYAALRANTSAANLSLPTRIEDAPDGFVYIVDTGDRSGSTGTRGQVVRVNRSTMVMDNVVVH
jgi:hypothetical protein